MDRYSIPVPPMLSMDSVMQMRWTLTAKLAMFAGVFLVLSLLAVGATLWISWNLEGGAAAVNEAGRLRMMSYRLALSEIAPAHTTVAQQLGWMEDSLALLRTGDHARPLFVPWDARLRARYATVLANWQELRPLWLHPSATRTVTRSELDHFVANVDAFVMSIERRLDFWSAMLHTAQLAMLGLVVIGTMFMFFAAYLLVLDPVGRLSRGVTALERGEYSARVAVDTTDELGDLAHGFNRMAHQLQAVYAELEERVRQKTADLQAEQRRLAALYEISAVASRAQSLDELADSFTRSMQRISGADAAVLRWTDESAQRYLLLAAEGVAPNFMDDERCLIRGSCYCGQAEADAGPQVVQFHKIGGAEGDPHSETACVRAGFSTLVSVPVSIQHRLLGEIDLLYRIPHAGDPAQHALLDTLAGHLAAAMESLRGAALEREAMVSQERALLARELHDSIAQALAFMKIQLQLLRTALKAGNASRIDMVVEELDLGVRESLVDVRELLLHFRTRTHAQDIEPALQSTLQKFELQSGIRANLHFNGQGKPLDPDVQVQVLHIVQEALSNVRKHARAQSVNVTVDSLPAWRFEICDDGVGFDMSDSTADSSAHIGQQIMSERAANIGATLHIESARGHGARVILELPQTSARSATHDLDTDAQSAHAD